MSDDLIAPLRHIILKHPWWNARARLALRLLRREGVVPPARVVDVGCGWGTNFLALERDGYRTTGLDISRPALEALDAPQRDLIQADLTKDLPGKRPGYDALLALDVIEHIDDDNAALRRFATLLAPQAVAIVSVPALPDLFSQYDAVQGHRRRYLQDTLRESFLGSGLELTSMFFWGGWMVPVLRAQRFLRRQAVKGTPLEVYRSFVSPPRWPFTLLMRGLFRLEERPAMRGALRKGTSLFVVARRSGYAGDEVAELGSATRERG